MNRIYRQLSRKCNCNRFAILCNSSLSRTIEENEREVDYDLAVTCDGPQNGDERLLWPRSVEIRDVKCVRFWGFVCWPRYSSLNFGTDGVRFENVPRGVWNYRKPGGSVDPGFWNVSPCFVYFVPGVSYVMCRYCG